MPITSLTGLQVRAIMRLGLRNSLVEPVDMDIAKKIAIVLLLPAVVFYLVWLIITAVRSDQAYFPRIGYCSRNLKPASFWALVCLSGIFAIGVTAGWFFLVIQYIDEWR